MPLAKLLAELRRDALLAALAARVLLVEEADSKDDLANEARPASNIRRRRQSVAAPPFPLRQRTLFASSPWVVSKRSVAT